MLIIVAIGCPMAASAADVYLDANGVTAGFGDLNGQTWDAATSTNWSASSAGTAAGQTWNALGGPTATAVFALNDSADPSVVSLANDFELSGIRLESSGALTLRSTTADLRQMSAPAGVPLVIDAGSSFPLLTMAPTIGIAAGTVIEKRGLGVLAFQGNFPQGRFVVPPINAGFNFLVLDDQAVLGAGVAVDLVDATSTLAAVSLANSITTAVTVGNITGEGAINQDFLSSNLSIQPVKVFEIVQSLPGSVKKITSTGITLFRKKGAATLTIDGTNRMAAGIEIAEGTLAVASGAALGSGVAEFHADLGPKITASTATLKIANGALVGVPVDSGPEGRIEIGEPGSVDVISLAGNATLTAGMTVARVTVGATAGSIDRLNLAGSIVTFGGTLTVSFENPVLLQPGATYTIAVGGVWTGAPAQIVSSPLPAGLALDAAYGSFAGFKFDAAAATLSFKMKDPLAPLVKIAKPKKNARFATSKTTVKGTASSAITIARVEYRVGKKGGYKKAKGTTGWSFIAKLKPGKNAISVRAVDGNGSVSALATRNVFRD